MSGSAQGPGPDFVGIGAQKAGTTWLFDNLAIQPGAWMPPAKEIRFFNTVCPHEELLGVETGSHPGLWDRYREAVAAGSLVKFRWLHRFHDHSDPPTTAWYHSLFPREEIGSRRAGDITPAYSTLDERGVRLARRVLRPGCRVVFIVRNPIDRAWSALKMLYRWRGQEVTRVEPTAILEHFESPTYRLRGDYVRTIRLWRGAFGDDLRVFRYDDLVADPESFLRGVCEFLEIPGELNTARLGMRSNYDPRKHGVPPELLALLEERFRTGIEELDDLVPGVAEDWLTERRRDSP